MNARRAIAETQSEEEFAFLADYDVPQLGRLIARAKDLQADKAAEEKAGVLERIRAEMADYGIGQQDLFGSSAKRSTAGSGTSPRRGVAPIKFKGPDGQEWSGRGRVPGWLSELEGQGRKRDEFLVGQ